MRLFFETLTYIFCLKIVTCNKATCRIIIYCSINLFKSTLSFTRDEFLMYRSISILTLTLIFSLQPAQGRDWLPDLNFFSSDEEGTTVWQAGQQYIKIVSREKSAELENQHPYEITVDKLQAVLSAISIEESSGIFNDELEQRTFFSGSDINTLSSGLARALERAKPNEDVVFVVIGRHKGLISKERKVIGGRAFVQDGKLNLILGDVYRPEGGSKEQRNRNMAAGCGGCDDKDIRTNPYIVGTRDKEHKLDLAFTKYDGIEMASPRSDWLKLDVDKVYAAVEKERNKLPPAMERERAKATQEAAKLNLERRQMREEMARMRKEMREMSGGDASSDSRTLEERLSTLDQLKMKGLIDDKEYEIKRQEILKDL